MRYICQICGYIYDDAKQKVPFAELPDDGRCPLCGAANSDFRQEGADPGAAAPEAAAADMEEKGTAAADMKAEPDTSAADVKADPDNLASDAKAEPDAKKLSFGQLAALCSNLARGCEKQYKPEEAGLFRQLADYFTAITPPVEDATVMKLAADLTRDIDGYADVRAAADAASDRGAARVCVWGEKVTRMLSSLISRYLKEGEAMLAGKNVWVCSTCGFVYIGDEAPEACPVCKVPAWKFEKVEGRA